MERGCSPLDHRVAFVPLGSFLHVSHGGPTLPQASKQDKSSRQFVFQMISGSSEFETSATETPHAVVALDFLIVCYFDGQS